MLDKIGCPAADVKQIAVGIVPSGARSCFPDSMPEFNLERAVESHKQHTSACAILIMSASVRSKSKSLSISGSKSALSVDFDPDSDLDTDQGGHNENGHFSLRLNVHFFATLTRIHLPDRLKRSSGSGAFRASGSFKRHRVKVAVKRGYEVYV